MAVILAPGRQYAMTWDFTYDVCLCEVSVLSPILCDSKVCEPLGSTTRESPFNTDL